MKSRCAPATCCNHHRTRHPDEALEFAMSLGPAGGIVRLAANRQARRAPDYRCVSKAATIATPMPSWCTAALGQSGQRRSLAQHGPSGLRAVAGAASATSAAASSPPRKRAPRRRRGRPRPGRGMSPFALAGPAMPDGTKAIEGHPRPHARACVRRPSARPGDVPRSGW